MMSTKEKLSVIATVAMYLIRLVQLGSLVIAGYGTCYLVWEHLNHYCSWYSCGMLGADTVAVPIGEVLFITASSLLTLEWMFFGGIIAFRAQTGKPAPVDASTQFACSCFSMFVYSIGLISFTSIPTVRASFPYCYNMWDTNRYDPPEKNYCIVTQSAVSCGLITWIMTSLVAILNLVEYRKDCGVGRIQLSDNTRLPSDADALSIQDVPTIESA
ncbi:hypothetical protein B0J13DRAFT_675565 [Dactylonectria estremocensis]|uniref:Uncharacterized protein n=1 Tax=Dactylonectria estremocensis TaxID=1079267 RepID=A0A9P9J115_9HYPO|nr:hypothetical protein B0J13DRAFT_675565 [Dactylonectria estremocensis]